MPATTMRGVFPILVMPFDERARIDEDSLRSLVDFNLAAGVHGLVRRSTSPRSRLSSAWKAQAGFRKPQKL